jgi:hypothetical protein
MGAANEANVFCFLSSLPLLPPATTAVFGYSTLNKHCIAGSDTYDGRGFVGPPKEDDLEPLSMQSSLGEAKSDEGAIRGRFLVSLLQMNREGLGLKAA